METNINALISIIIFIIGILAIVLVVNSDKNTLEWYHLVSSGAKDGKTYLDWNKIAQGCGVFITTVMPFMYMSTGKPEATGLALVMVTSLTYLAGVTTYSTRLKSRNPEVRDVQP
jgi:hypothetical protein